MNTNPETAVSTDSDAGAGFPRLVADIGATHARFARCDAPGSTPRALRKLHTRDFATLEEALRTYAGETDLEVEHACLAVAGPVSGEQIRLTNGNWCFTRDALAREFGFRGLRILNDLEAIALAVAFLGPDDFRAIGGGETASDAPMAVVAPGTGLGMSLLLPCGEGWHLVATEGGHATLAPGNEREEAVFDYWLTRGGRLSREHFLSGPGLMRIHEALASLEATPAPAQSPEEISALAETRHDPVCLETLEIFMALLGSTCGDQALSTGARGGVWLAGGILPHLSERLEQGPFRARFEDKAPMTDWVSAIATRLITAAEPGLTGAARARLNFQR